MKRARWVKQQLYEQFARIGKALDSPQRLELLDLLCQGERPVEDLAKEANLSFANASRHLQILRAARLIDARRAGRRIYYRLADDEVCSFFRSMRVLAEKRLSEIHRIMANYFGDREDMEPVDRLNLLNRARRGEAIILDVRPRVEYETSHLPYAVSVPLGELESILDDLPEDHEIVAYCRGPYCVLAQEAVRYLQSKGYRASLLKDGVLEWKDAGLPLESEIETDSYLT